MPATSQQIADKLSCLGLNEQEIEWFFNNHAAEAGVDFSAHPVEPCFLNAELPDFSTFESVTLSANQTNWAAPNLMTAPGWRITPSNNVSIYGIAAPSPVQQLERWIYIERAPDRVVYLRDDQNSTPANRFYLPNDTTFILRPSTLSKIIYVPALSRWVLNAPNRA